MNRWLRRRWLPCWLRWWERMGKTVRCCGVETGRWVSARSFLWYAYCHRRWKRSQANDRIDASVFRLDMMLGRDAGVCERKESRAIHLAAAMDDRRWLDAALRQTRYIDTPNGDGDTALHYAVAFNQGNNVNRLMRLGADPNYDNNDRIRPIHRAALSGNDDTMMRLVNNGAVPYVYDQRGWMPIHWAAVHGCTTTLQVLLQKGVSPHQRTLHGETALHMAIDHKGRVHQDIITLLVNHGAPVHHQNANGESAWEKAVRLGVWNEALHAKMVALERSHLAALGNVEKTLRRTFSYVRL